MAPRYRYNEAAAKLGIHPDTLRHWVAAGKVACHRLGRNVYFTDADLESAFRPAPALPAVVRQRGQRRRR